jgi:hypothetical protein
VSQKPRTGDPSAAKPSKLLRISVAPAASQIRVPVGKPIIDVPAPARQWLDSPPRRNHAGRSSRQAARLRWHPWAAELPDAVETLKRLIIEKDLADRLLIEKLKPYLEVAQCVSRAASSL